MLWKCERSHHITTLALGATTPPNEINAGLLEEQRRHDPLSTMHVYGTHIFNLSAMTGTIILPSASSSSLGGDGIRIIQQSRRSGRLYFPSVCNRARRGQLRFLGIGYAMIPDAGASGFLLSLLFFSLLRFDFRRSRGRSRLVPMERYSCSFLCR